MKRLTPLLLSAIVLFFAFAPAGDGGGHWQKVTTKNDPGGRSECSMAAVNGKLYLIGGDGGGALPVQCLDPKTLTWTKLAPAPSVMHHLQVVALNGKVYALEAFSNGGFPNQEPMANVEVYDTKTDTWQQGGEMPVARRRAAAGAAAYKGKLYLVCGIQHGHSSGTNAMFDVYDPATGTWTPLPDAPHIRDHCFAAVIGDRLYVAGGRNTSFRDPTNKLNFFSQVVLDVDYYDFVTGTWATLAAKLPLGSGGGNLVTINNRLYYLGGERATATENNQARKNTFFIDPSVVGAQWQETDSLKSARNGVAAAVLNGKIYVAGGAMGPGGPGGGPGGPPPMGPPPGGNMPGDTSHRPQPGQMPQGMPPGGGGGGSISVEVFSLN